MYFGAVDLPYRSDMLYILYVSVRVVVRVGFGRSHTLCLRDINLTLRLLPSRRHVIWRDSVGVGVLGQALNQSVRVIFQ